MVNGVTIGEIMIGVGVLVITLSFMKALRVILDLKQEVQDLENSRMDWISICDDRIELIEELNGIQCGLYEVIAEKEKAIEMLLMKIDDLEDEIVIIDRLRWEVDFANEN